MKIGDKEIKAKINNRVIFDIEEHFDKEIMALLSQATNLKTRQMAEFIHFAYRDDFDGFDDFIDSVPIKNYVDMAGEVANEIAKAFGLGMKIGKKK